MLELKKPWSWVLFLCLIVTIQRGFALADDTVATEEEALKIGNPPKQFRTSHDVEMIASFPRSSSKTVAPGSTLEVSILFKNQNDSLRFIIKHAVGVLTEKDNASKLLQKLKKQSFEVDVEPHSNSPVTFRVNISPRMKPSTVGCVIVVQFEDASGEVYRGIGYNGFIEIIEYSGFDFQDLSVYVIVFAFLVGTSYWAKQSFLTTAPVKSHKLKSKSASKQNVSEEVPTSSETHSDGKSYDEDWIPAHHLQQTKSKKSPKLRKKKA